MTSYPIGSGGDDDNNRRQNMFHCVSRWSVQYELLPTDGPVHTFMQCGCGFKKVLLTYTHLYVEAYLSGSWSGEGWSLCVRPKRRGRELKLADCPALRGIDCQFRKPVGGPWRSIQSRLLKVEQLHPTVRHFTEGKMFPAFLHTSMQT